MDPLRLYFRMVAFSFRAQLQYRLNFSLQVAAQFLVTAVEFLAVWALFHRFSHLQGWTFAEICFFYGTVNVTFALADAFSRGFDQFAVLVRSGEFDRILLRPRSPILQILGQELTLRRAGRLAQALLVLALGFSGRPDCATPENFIILGWAVAGGICLFLGILMIQATICFWTVESIEMMNVFTYGAVFTGQFPLAIYEEWLRKFFTCVIPLACVLYFPVLAVLGRGEEFGVPAPLAWFSPLAGPLFLFLANRIWQAGVRRYCSTGT